MREEILRGFLRLVKEASLEGEEESLKGVNRVVTQSLTTRSLIILTTLWKRFGRQKPMAGTSWPSTQKITAGVYKELEKLQPLCFVGRNASWCIHYGKQHESSLKMKLEAYTQKNLKQAFKEIFVHSCS